MTVKQILNPATSFIAAALFALLITGCNIRDDSGCTDRVSTLITVTEVTIDRQMLPHPDGEVILGRAPGHSTDLRIRIDACLPNGSVLQRFYTTTHDTISSVHRLDAVFTLPADKCVLVVWADYVESSSGTDLLYHTADLREITLRTPYPGGTEMKDAYTTCMPLDLTHTDGKPRQVSIPLRRPLARVSIVADDVDEFVSSGGDTGGIYARIIYPGFHLTGYSALEGIPNDASTGCAFDFTASAPESGHMLLAWDYLLATDDKTNVTASMIVYNRSGQVINTIADIKIPILRGYHTVVRGDLLTGKQGSGIGVDSDYDGIIDFDF